MFQSLFNYDNPVWRFIGKLGDLILLNVLWIICSIPIFTIGAGRGRADDPLLFPVLQGEFQAGYGAVASDSSDRNCAGI